MAKYPWDDRGFIRLQWQKTAQIQGLREEKERKHREEIDRKIREIVDDLSARESNLGEFLDRSDFVRQATRNWLMDHHRHLTGCGADRVIDLIREIKPGG